MRRTSDVRFSVDLADAQARLVAARLIGGTLEFYVGDRPENFGDIDTTKRLASLRFRSFEPPVGGLLRASVMDDPDAALKGDATWYLCRAADGSIALDDKIAPFSVERRARVYVEGYEIDFVGMQQ